MKIRKFNEAAVRKKNYTPLHDDSSMGLNELVNYLKSDSNLVDISITGQVFSTFWRICFLFEGDIIESLKKQIIMSEISLKISDNYDILNSSSRIHRTGDAWLLNMELDIK